MEDKDQGWGFDFKDKLTLIAGGTSGFEWKNNTEEPITIGGDTVYIQPDYSFFKVTEWECRWHGIQTSCMLVNNSNFCPICYEQFLLNSLYAMKKIE